MVGGLGGIAILFFWIGNAIIVARLRAYNLYGVVHYTDEYVTEAGYQFFQDIFTFFQDWRLIPFFVFLMALLLLTVPAGRSRAMKGDNDSTVGRQIVRSVTLLRQYGINYGIFLALALSATFILTSGWFVKKLSSDIVKQERLLADIAETANMGALKGVAPTLTTPYAKPIFDLEDEWRAQDRRRAEARWESMKKKSNKK